MQESKTHAIFNAAVDVFSERGFEKATMDEIAAKAKVAKGTIYYHFKSKEDLFVFLVEEGTRLLGDSVLSKLPTEASAAEQLRVIVREQLAFFQEYRDFCIIILLKCWRKVDQVVVGTGKDVMNGADADATKDGPRCCLWVIRHKFPTGDALFDNGLDGAHIMDKHSAKFTLTCVFSPGLS